MSRQIQNNRIKQQWPRLLTRPRASEGLLSSVRSYVGNKGKPRGLRDTSADATGPFTSVVRLVYTDVIYVNLSVFGLDSVHHMNGVRGAVQNA